LQSFVHKGQVWHAVISPDGKTAACLTREDSAVWLWNIETGEPRGDVEVKARPSEAYSGLAFSPDGATLVVTTTERAWLVKAATGHVGQTLQEYGGFGFDPAWSKDGKTVFAHNRHGIRFWNAQTGARQRPLSLLAPPVESQVPAWSRDGKFLALPRASGRIRLWDTRSTEPPQNLEGPPVPILNLAWSPDSKHLAAGSPD